MRKLLQFHIWACSLCGSWHRTCSLDDRAIVRSSRKHTARRSEEHQANGSKMVVISEPHKEVVGGGASAKYITGVPLCFQCPQK